MKPLSRAEYLAAAFCIGLFVAAQTFQEFAYRFWIPTTHGPQDDLLTYLLPIDRARSVLIMGTIVVLVVPFMIIALRCFKAAPVASVLGLVFGAGFIFFEISHRGIDYFVVGGQWASQFAKASSAAERENILQRFALWNEVVQGWYFPLLLSYFLCSCSFAIATWKRGGNRWYYLAPIAFVLNALRVLGRLLSNYGGQKWLDGFNGSLYFPGVLTVNLLLMMWFFFLARHAAEDEQRRAL
jgi:hypothetical protein